MCFYFLENESHTLLSVFFLHSSAAVYSFLGLISFCFMKQTKIVKRQFKIPCL